MGSRRTALESITASADTNAGLWLEKGLRDIEKGGPGRQAHFDELIETIRVPADYGRFFQRWQASLEALEPCTRTERVTVEGRMAVGLGAESVLETALALHRTYGVPFIPASALKGLAAASAHRNLQDPSWRKIGEDGKIGPSHRILFGDQKSSGYVTFHDALWVPAGDKLPLDLDVMTVHHPEYYQGTSAAPADWDSPNPVAFLSARGTYLLAVTGHEEWVDAALAILKEAFEKDGIGAKTAAGYGRMKAERKSEPVRVSWEPQVKGLNLGNAADAVPRILDQQQGEERRRAAAAIVLQLDRKTLLKPKHKDKEWVRRLQEAGD